MTTDEERIGRLDERMKALERDMDGIRSDTKDIKQSLEALSKTLNEARGGWRTLMWLGGAVAALGGVLGWALQHLRWTP